METYVILGNYTEQGIANMKDISTRIEQTKAAVEGAGGEWLGYWMTIGRYDFVVITRSPDAATAATLLLATAMAGNVRTETLRAFTFEEATAIAANLP